MFVLAKKKKKRTRKTLFASYDFVIVTFLVLHYTQYVETHHHIYIIKQTLSYFQFQIKTIYIPIT